MSEMEQNRFPMHFLLATRPPSTMETPAALLTSNRDVFWPEFCFLVKPQLNRFDTEPREPRETDLTEGLSALDMLSLDMFWLSLPGKNI